MDSNNSESGSSSRSNDPKLPEPPSAEVEVVVAEEEAPNMEVNQPNRGSSPQNTAPISSPHELEKTFSCKHCNKRFSTCMALGGHQNAHRKERAMEKMMLRDKKLFHPYKGHNFSPPRRMDRFAGGSVTNPWSFSQLAANPSYIPYDVVRQLIAALPNPHPNIGLPNHHHVDDQQRQLVLPNPGQTLDHHQQHGDRLHITVPPNHQPHTLGQFVPNWRGQQRPNPGFNQGGGSVTSIYDQMRFRGEIPQNNQAANSPLRDRPLLPQRPIPPAPWDVGSSSRSGVPQQQQHQPYRLPFYEFLPPAANVRTSVEEPNTPPRPETGETQWLQVDDPGERNGGAAATNEETETNANGNGAAAGNPQQEGGGEEGGGEENRDDIDLNLKLA